MPYEDNKKWRIKNPRKRQVGAYRNYERSIPSSPNLRPYTRWEDALVLKHEIKDRELGKLIERSARSIQVRRAKLKSISDLPPATSACSELDATDGARNTNESL